MPTGRIFAKIYDPEHHVYLGIPVLDKLGHKWSLAMMRL
jgi:hypothetical protein